MQPQAVFLLSLPLSLNSRLCRGLEFVCLSKMDASTVDRNGYAKVPVR